MLYIAGWFERHKAKNWLRTQQARVYAHLSKPLAFMLRLYSALYH
jgi:hypothetical protein